jgi:hypothetical protein
MNMARKCTLASICVVAVWLFGAQCVTTPDVEPGDGGGGGAGTSKVTVRLVNGSPTAAVDVLLYATGQAVTNADTELFLPANQQLAGIGFAGSGILQPGQVDEVQLDCTAAAAIGTLGGAFLNADTGTQIGTGTRYVLVQGSQFQCGSTITFTYAPSGSGFRTDLAIAGPGG